MADVGKACLAVGLLTALYAAGAAIYGARGGGPRWVVSARHAIYALAGLLVTSFVILEAAYLRSDFSYELVATNSSTDTPTFYKFTAIWSSQAGSLLLWVLLLSLFSSAVLRATRNQMREVVPYATAVLGVVASFFLMLTVFYASPFDTLANPPTEGNGLNPLLRHPAMMFHPPMLYTGYVGFSIPFAFAVGALITRRTGMDWIRSTRRFALIAWTFLGFGIMLGSLWSFAELGWGGYWGWDAVENASLMPWLIGTAYLHSIQVEEKRGMLRVWNVSLVMASFVLALLGTFLVRSGILDSIHAFGASTLGKPFLFFISACAVGSVVLVVSRLDHLRSDAKLESIWSREGAFLLNNLVLVALAFVIWWGTFFPLISEAIGGKKASVGPPWFDRYTVPLALALVLLAGIGPVLTWRKISSRALRRTLVVPVVATGVVLCALLAFTDASKSWTSLAMFSLITFVLAVISQEFWRGVNARRVMTREAPPTALTRLVARNRRRWGGYIVHVGIAVLFLGVAASSAFHSQRDVRLSKGQTTTVGGYQVKYLRPTADVGRDTAGTGAPISLGAVLDVSKNGKHTIVRPKRNFYPVNDPSVPMIARFFEGEPTSEVDVRWGLSRDLWFAVQPDLASLMPAIRQADTKFNSPQFEKYLPLLITKIAQSYAVNPPPANFRMIVSPMVSFIWIGGLIAVFGALIAVWPGAETRRRRVHSVYAARLARELSRA
ncbi:MAG TPA: cytochrome c-type biogenesis CcmF C-terminal domain-containing protein [Thermoleophilaceae bacterium]|jgi:cytochrome c-type biogenesis protein CcmF|nr:cytochrome c-type biogenesis CcmF C-terminal domain-containing protein [Thermoleophilaceae bacterium]